LTQVKGAAGGRVLDAAQYEFRNHLYRCMGRKTEVNMSEFSERGATIVEESVADTATRLTKANKNALEFLMGAQKIVLEESTFVGNEVLDRARTETHLLSEFISKMAGSHSVKDLKTMWEECGQHQIDFIRRDSERLFKHGGRMIEATAKLFGNQPGS
jgi:hypothetical protein